MAATITILDSDKALIVTLSSEDIQYMSKQNTEVAIESGEVVLRDKINPNRHFAFQYIDVLDPAASDNANLAEIIQTYLNNPTSIYASSIASSMPSPIALQNNAVANGNGNNLSCAGYTVALLSITTSVAMSGGTTINFEASVDNTTWVSIAAHKIGVNGSLATTTTSVGDYRLAIAGYSYIRARISAYSAGTISIAGYVSVFASQPTVIALGAGENHVGAVGGNSDVVTSTVVMSAAGSYATGDYMGTTTTPQAFANAVRVSGGTGIIKSVFISDKIVTANVAMELWIFSATFVAPTDNAAWAISDTEALSVLAVIPIATTGWYASSNNQIYIDSTLAIPIKCAATSLFYALVARGTTPSFTSLDLTIGLGILQD